MSHILLVDDDPDILNVLGATFETAGHDIVTTTDPLSIDDLLETQSFDAVVLDVMMPRRSGWEVLERLRQDPSTRALPVILLSAVGDPSNRVRGIRLGADDFLAKPFDPEEVLVRVEGLLARRQPGQGNFQGNLSTISLAEVLQTLQQTRASGTLEIAGPTGRGEIQLLDGLIRGAQFGRWLGADAVSTLLTLKAGSFRLLDEPGTAPTLPRPINFQGLLLDTAWVEDELQRRQSHQPADDQPLRRTTKVLGAPPEMPSVPIDWVMASIVERPGATLGQLIEDAPSTAARVRLAVAWLLEEGLLHRQVAPPSPAAGPPVKRADDNRPPDGSGSWAAIGDPDLGDLLAEFSAEARRKGFREPPSLAVLIHPRAWASFPPWLVSLARRNQAGAKAVSVRVEPPGGGAALDLVFRSLAGHTEDPSLAEFAALVVWLGNEPWTGVNKALETAGRHFHGEALRLVVARESRGEFADESAGRRWKSIAQPPENLSHLLEILLSPVL